MTIRELLNERLGAQITCAVTGRVVRYLALDGDYVDVKTADGTEVAVRADEKLSYEPWFMDRGSILVTSCDHGVIKLMTEYDLVTLDDGVVCTLEAATKSQYRDGHHIQRLLR